MSANSHSHGFLPSLWRVEDVSLKAGPLSNQSLMTVELRCMFVNERREVMLHILALPAEHQRGLGQGSDDGPRSSEEEKVTIGGIFN